MIADDERKRLTAAVDLLRRLGAEQYQVRYSDDKKPIIWFAVAMFRGGRWEAAAGHNPVEATTRLAERLVDGGTCTHCLKPTGLEEDHAATSVELFDQVCWYVYDPELHTYRRSCA